MNPVADVVLVEQLDGFGCKRAAAFVVDVILHVVHEVSPRVRAGLAIVV